MKVKISNWGNYPDIETDLRIFSNEKSLETIISETGELITRGLGRCYGDSSLNENILSSLYFSRVLSFDENSGTITCQAGISLREILDIFLPRGWFLPVTPGTKFVTLGGAIAADVHGKNHHKAGSFSNHLLSMDVLIHDGAVVTCSKDKNPDMFEATCGGFGLTGVILRATFRLFKIESAYMKQETLIAKNIDEIMEIFEASQDFSYSVAWMDCINVSADNVGRSVLIRGEHALRDEISFREKPFLPPVGRNINVPFNMPGFFLNGWSGRVFNNLYYKKATRAKQQAIVDYNSFFYPLDRILNWNKIYGRRGFIQYQFVLPKDKSGEGIKKILAKIRDGRQKPFLAVLKLFGKQESFISFPMEGYTLALDFPMARGLLLFLDELDKIVLDFGGRLYLAKDARMDSEMFLKSYENSAKFIECKYRFDGAGKFRSLQSKRLGI